MAIQVSYYGNKKPAPNVKPQRVINLPDNTPKDKLPFGKANPIDWMTGKRLVQFKKDEQVKIEADKSITLTEDGVLELVGDVASPGKDKVYGTDSSGNREWRDAPKSVSDGTDDGQTLIWDEDAAEWLAREENGKVRLSEEDALGFLSDKVDGSVAGDDGKLTLIGDNATPGNNKVYGTDNSGVKGWRDVPVSCPGNPTSPTSFGSGTSESAASDTWLACSDPPKGLAIPVVTRVVYDPSGDKAIYRFHRILIFDSYGRLYSVSAETRTTVATTTYIE